MTRDRLGDILYGLVGLALLPPLGAVLGRGLVLMDESTPLAVVMGWF